MRACKCVYIYVCGGGGGLMPLFGPQSECSFAAAHGIRAVTMQTELSLKVYLFVSDSASGRHCSDPS